MKKLVLVSTIIFITISASAQLVRPNRPTPTLDGSRGYITINEFASGFGLSGRTVPYSQSYYGITSLHAYQVNEMFMVGAATGLLFYRDGLMIPLYLDMRVRLTQTTMFPFLSGAGGLLISPADVDAGTRMFINPAAGLMYTIRKEMAVSISAGLQMQMAPNTGRASFFTSKIGVVYKF